MPPPSSPPRPSHHTPDLPNPDDSIPASARLLQLFYGSHLIREAAVALRLSHCICASAQLLFHRFYARVSLRQHNVVWAVGASLLLSCKQFDEERSLRDISSVLHDRVLHRECLPLFTNVNGTPVRRVLHFFGAQGYDWETGIVQMERDLLHTIGFRLTADLPHKFVLVFVNELREKAKAESWNESSHQMNPFQPLLQYAWNFANDAMLIPVSVLERPEDIACACIDLALSKASFQLPSGWQVVFGSSTSESDRIAALIETVYEFEDVCATFVDFSLTDTFSAFHPTIPTKKKKRKRFADA